jgi:N-acetylglutamate synthase-like GNAT family acetyltransferase/chloramphenicol 3-O-phosphotransferase
VLVLFGGPAGAGKSTLAAAWCATRSRAAHVELDAVRQLIVAGRADPQEGGSVQSAQYALSVRACCALARAFDADGYDVAVDDVLEPAAFEREWRPALAGLEWRLVVLLPRLEEVLARSSGRAKRVREEHSRAQHATCGAWAGEHRIDTTGLSVDESLALLRRRLEAVTPPDNEASRAVPTAGSGERAAPPGYLVRTARPDDLSAVGDLARRWEAEGITLGYIADAEADLAPRLGPRFLIGERAGTIVGYAIGGLRDSEGLVVVPRGVTYLEIEDLYVRADHRGRGLGRTLLHRLVDGARADGVERALVYSSNRDWERTARFYAAHGFGM